MSGRNGPEAGLDIALRDIVRVAFVGTERRSIGRVVAMMEAPGRPVSVTVEDASGALWSGLARDVLVVRTDETNKAYVNGADWWDHHRAAAN